MWLEFWENITQAGVVKGVFKQGKVELGLKDWGLDEGRGAESIPGKRNGGNQGEKHGEQT